MNHCFISHRATNRAEVATPFSFSVLWVKLTALAVAALMLTACSSGPKPPVAAAPTTPAAAPTGSVTGTADRHTPASAQAVLANAWLVLPPKATGGVLYEGLLKAAPAATARVPVVVFAHGSSGIAPAIKEWQRWLANDLGIASVAPDSMQLPDRINYKSPVDKAVYERVHALRASELAMAMAALPQWAWADTSRVVLAGTSEGAVSVARYQRAANAPAATPNEVGRIIYSWSCEDNYHVAAHRTAIPTGMPVLNVMSSADPYFSQRNAWLGNPRATGSCSDVLRTNPRASVVMIPDAPHTLFNLPQAKGPTEAFLRETLRLM